MFLMSHASWKCSKMGRSVVTIWIIEEPRTSGLDVRRQWKTFQIWIPVIVLQGYRKENAYIATQGKLKIFVWFLDWCNIRLNGSVEKQCRCKNEKKKTSLHYFFSFFNRSSWRNNRGLLANDLGTQNVYNCHAYRTRRKRKGKTHFIFNHYFL